MKIHNITSNEYKKLFPKANFLCKRLSKNISNKADGHKGYNKGKINYNVRRGIYRNCNKCGKEYYIPQYKKYTSRFCSKKCAIDIIGELHRGENHHNWRGGSENYYGPNWNYQKRKTRARDNNTCQVCGIRKDDLKKELDVHHIIPFRNFGLDNYIEANNLNNLISLCHICHARITNGKKLIVNNTYLGDNGYER